MRSQLKNQVMESRNRQTNRELHSTPGNNIFNQCKELHFGVKGHAKEECGHIITVCRPINYSIHPHMSNIICHILKPYICIWCEVL